MTRKFLLAAAGYLVVSMVLGTSWHFLFFKGVYDSLSIYNRTEPIIPLGLLSLMGLSLFSMSTLANAAKIHISSISTWLLVQTGFHLIQFILTGMAIGIAYGDTKGEQP